QLAASRVCFPRSQPGRRVFGADRFHWIEETPSPRIMDASRRHLKDRLSEPEYTADDRSMLHNIEDEIAIFIIDTHCTISSDHGERVAERIAKCTHDVPTEMGPDAKPANHSPSCKVE